MAYSKQEDELLNKQLEKLQHKQLKAVKRNNIDRAFEKMNEYERSAWEIVSNAKSHKDVNYLVWDIAEKVIDKYYKLAR